MLASTMSRVLGLLVAASSLALCAPLERPVTVLEADNALEERNPAVAMGNYALTLNALDCS